MRYRLGVFFCVCLLLIIGMPVAGANAYLTEARWVANDGGNYANYVDYQVDPNLDAKLNANNNGTVQSADGELATAARQWSQPSPFQMYQSPGWDPNHRNAITARDFRVEDPCNPGNPGDDKNYAQICADNKPPVDSGQISSRPMYLNSSATRQWNSQGIQDNTVQPIKTDFRTIVLHELGHTMGLDHDCRYNPTTSPSVMCFQGYIPQRELYEDDKQGVVQLYGPMTDWEENKYQARGDVDAPAYTRTASALQLGPTGAEFGVTPIGGTRQERFAGNADTDFSFAYMRLFTSELDASTNPNPYVRIDNGMQLHWRQFNYRQQTVSLDIEFTDGTTLRDSTVFDNGQYRHLRDNYCISVHPAEREYDCNGQYVSTENRWVEYIIDLSPLAGKKIKRTFIAYDNSQSRLTGPFRAYFDDLYLGIPNYGAVRGYTTGQGTVSASPNQDHVPANTVVTYTATPAAGWLHTGWLVDGRKVGWANPLSVTMDVRHTVTAVFDPIINFSDVPTSHPYYEAIRQLAARRVVRGYNDGTGRFGPNDTVLRAQMAALIARGVDWDLQDWGNPFPDKCDPLGSALNCIDDALWRNVGTLNHYNVARGYADGNYYPRDNVLYAQSISFITRAMVAKGYWQQRPTNSGIYGGVLNGTGHEQDVTTYCYYAGPVPGTSSCSSAWPSWNQPAQRGWFSEALWRALNGYLSVDRVP